MRAWVALHEEGRANPIASGYQGNLALPEGLRMVVLNIAGETLYPGGAPALVEITLLDHSIPWPERLKRLGWSVAHLSEGTREIGWVILLPGREPRDEDLWR